MTERDLELKREEARKYYKENEEKIKMQKKQSYIANLEKNRQRARERYYEKKAKEGIHSGTIGRPSKYTLETAENEGENL